MSAIMITRKKEEAMRQQLRKARHHKKSRKVRGPSGPLLGLGTRGYLETPSAMSASASQSHNRMGGSEVEYSTSSLSLIDERSWAPVPPKIHSDILVGRKSSVPKHEKTMNKQAGRQAFHNTNTKAQRDDDETSVFAPPKHSASIDTNTEVRTKTAGTTTRTLATTNRGEKWLKIRRPSRIPDEAFAYVPDEKKQQPKTRAVLSNAIGANRSEQDSKRQFELITLAGQSNNKNAKESQYPRPQRRTSNSSGSEPNSYASCGESNRGVSRECATVLQNWPLSYIEYQFIYILSWNGIIYGGMNRWKRIYLFSEVLDFPMFGMPSNMLIPVHAEIKALVDSLRTDKTISSSSDEKKQSLPLPEGWKWLPHFASFLPGFDLKGALLEFWKQMTNQCIGPICAMNHVLDPLTKRCMSRMLLLEPIAATGFEKITDTKLYVDDYQLAQRKWQGENAKLLLYTSSPVAPQVQLIGVISKPTPPYSSGSSTPQNEDLLNGIALFPYPIPISNDYEFNKDAFGLPDIYLLPILKMIQVPGINNRLRRLTLSAMNQILLDIQVSVGDFIIKPPTCLFETALDRPGAYMIRDSVCHPMKSDVRYLAHDVKSDSKIGTPSQSVALAPSDITSETQPYAFVAYIAERDARYPSRVNVLAGFNSRMQLIVPESPLQIDIDQTSSIRSTPVEFSRQLEPFVYGTLSNEAVQRLGNMQFLERLVG